MGLHCAAVFLVDGLSKYTGLGTGPKGSFHYFHRARATYMYNIFGHPP
jgi:hypothetical protein